MNTDLILGMLQQVPPNQYALAAAIALVVVCTRVKVDMEWKSGKLNCKINFTWRLPRNE